MTSIDARTSVDGVVVLGPDDMAAFLAVTRRDPVVNVFPEYRGRSTHLDPRWLGGEVWGRFVDGTLVAALHVGANAVPISCDAESAGVFAARMRALPRRSCTLVGPRSSVEVLWEGLRDLWGEPRDVRWDQPHLEIRTAPAIVPDPSVRLVEPHELEALYPACVAMYTEEVGVSPEAGGNDELYRARVRQLIGRRWSFARFGEDGRVEFKAEVACASPYAAQVQGVWVRPDLRGRGIAAPATAAVVQLARTRIAPVVSLYVNDFNHAARAAYTKVGFTHTATFSTVMF
ncbi:GNAT family N-acetyltransferase [Nocardioides yefusunii]|uniref:GNAT family N-acetyltransferase n=1 Tax=Nocardioides yefusunii TaxID=2500546 RepID=A0ABW1QV50_9ACTN|nr:GNAT family N-acetyltransferase [Nocardioides yefusunii]